MRSVLLIIGLLLVAAVVYFGVGAFTTPVNLPTIPKPSQQPIGGGPGNVTSQMKNITVEAMPFEFNPKEIRVKKGNTVRLTLKNNEGFHDWTLDEFNARTKQIQAGQTDTIQFVADKAGTFEYYCSVGNHRQMGMVGNLIVE